MRMRLHLAVLTTSAMLVGGCSSSSADAGGPGTGNGAPPRPGQHTTTTETFSFNGATRKYILSVPKDAGAGARVLPLVMVLHGNPGTAEFMHETYPFEPTVGSDAVVVYPNALGSDWDLYTPLAGNPDMAYLQALVGEVGKHVPVDASRVLGTGWSGGGFMVSQTACRMSGLFKAIAINAGGAPAEPNVPDAPKHANGFLKCPGDPTATLVVHGTDDTTVTPGSGEFAATYWAYANQCGATQSATSPSPCKSYDGCPPATPVTYCSIPGLGHPLWNEAHATAWSFFTSL